MCHGAGSTLPSFESLARFEALVVADADWIVPGEPASSGLLDLLAGNGPGAFEQMPPAAPYFDTLDPTDESLPNRDDLAGWIERLTGVPGETCWEAPGPKLMPRLNRTEYNNAVQALLNIDATPADDFPADDAGEGLDNQTGSLSISPLLIEKYELAAGSLAEAVLPPLRPSRVYALEAEDMNSNVGQVQGDGWNLWSNGDLTGVIELADPGRYRARARVSGGQAGPDPVRFEVLINNVTLGTYETRHDGPGYVAVDTGALELNAGENFLTIRFLNDYYCTQERLNAGQCPTLGDRNLLIDRLELEGPEGGNAEPTAFERRFFGDCAEGDLDCARAGLMRFGRLAWRHTLSDADADRLWALVTAELEEPGGLRAGLRQAVHALLLSPHFLMRVEAAGPPGGALSGAERATRLAAFLWRSVPDEALLDRAEAGQLNSAEGMAAAAVQMFADPRAQDMIGDFGTQWLLLRQTEVADPEYAQFPDFDEDLRAAMMQETRQVFAEVWNGGGSILDVVDANFTYVNARLAAHYGIEGIEGDAMQRVALPQAGRQGLLTQAAWLTATSHRTRTSPVKRGKWVLEELLCAAPPPAPPNVEGLIENVDQELPLRQRLEQHRADPACAACHRNMDAIGFGLEQFDATGAFRLTDAGEVIEPAGILLGDTPFEDGVSMARAIRNHPNLGPCVLDKLVTYALGRSIESEEHCMVEDIDARAAQSDYTARAVIEAIVQSPLFTVRGGTQTEVDAEMEGGQ